LRGHFRLVASGDSLMASLWRKELWAMLPFLSLVIFISLLNVFDECLSHQPDLRPLASSAEGYVTLSAESSYMLFILVFATGTWLLVRDHDEGSLEFLDSLPLTRTQVFVAKFLAAELVLWLVPATNVVIAAVLHALSRTSLDPSFHLDILLMSMLLYMCQITVFLALAMALSFLRRFAWVVACLLFWTYILLRDIAPSVSVLNLFALTTPQFEGQRWIWPTELLKFQLPLAAALLGFAYLMFVGGGDRLLKAYDTMSKTRVGGAVLIGGGMLASVLCLSIMVWIVETDPTPSRYDQPPAAYVSWSTARARTRHYSFVFPTNLGDRARGLIDRADDVHDAVQAFLQADPVAGQISVDMTSHIARHAGQAYWKRIRLDLQAHDEPDKLRAVLGHETTHVLADRVSNSRLTDAFNSIRFFHEGLASYVEHRLFGNDATIATLRSVAATMRHRRLVEFDELVDDDGFRRKHDTNLVYPLGEVFVATLVDRHGDGAPAALLRSFGRKEAPERLAGIELWQDTFQAAGFNLDETIDGFYARLDSLLDEHRAFLDSLPRPRGAVRFQGERVGIEVVGDVPAGWEATCRFRQDADDADHQYFSGDADNSHTFWVHRDDLPGPTFWYQVGLRETSGERVVFEPWLQVRSRR
jgi:ABC-type transport system involved in multi-copper enzyme maturation permease subunit